MASPSAAAGRPSGGMLVGMLASLLLIHCAGFFEQAGRVMVSEEEEQAIGEAFHRHLLTNDTARQQYPVYTPGTPAQRECVEYVQGVFRRVLAQVPAEEKPGYPFNLTIIAKEEENAFAVPGGYVYITTGMLEALQDEAELGGVLAHEIAHITEHHYREAVARNAALVSALQLVLAGTEAGQAGRMAAGAFHQLASLRFSRGAEREADELGARYAARAGLSPMGIASYFQRKKGQPLPQFLSTHPGPRNRVENIEELIERNPELQEAVGQVNREQFQAGTRCF